MIGKKSAFCWIFILAALLSTAQGTEGNAEESLDAVSVAGLLAVPLLPVEAPQSLLSLKLGDSDVELIAQGYWEASILASGAFGLGANGGLSAPTLLFRQVPDLWLSLTLMDRWFLEASLSADGFGDEYAAGYRGGDGDFLREVRLGNKGVSFPELPFLSLGAGAGTSFGLSALGQSTDGSAHFLVRYDQARRVTQTWVGDRELVKTEYRPSKYIRGRWFVLPDTGMTDLELFIESSSGTLTGSDSRKYRKMSAEEYALSAATGRLDLAVEVGKERRLLVCYSGMTIPGPPTTDTAPFYGRVPATVSVDSLSAMVLYEQGVQEGFLIANRYSLASNTATTSSSAFVRDAATGLTDPSYTATVLYDGYVEVVHDGLDPVPPGGMDYRMPFLAAMSWVYDPEATEEAVDTAPTEPAPAYSKILVLNTYGAPGVFILEEEGVLPGSIEVRRNGVLEYGFRYDPASNTVRLDRKPGISETIEVSYLLSSSDRSAGSLVAAIGGIFDVSSDWKAWTALGLRWGLPGTGYSETGEVTPGSLTLTAGISGGSSVPAADAVEPADTLRAEAALAARYRREDAVGFYRAAGMEESSSWTSPFRPEGAWPLTVDVTAVADETLKDLFPDLYARFHSASSTQKALELAFDAHDGTAVSIVRYVEPVAAGDYKTLAFFARREDADDAGADLTITISETSPAVSATLPLTEVSTEWRLFLLRYDGVPGLYAQASEGGAENLVGSAALVVDATKTAGKITITVDGVTDGSVFVDEIYFQDPVGQYSLSGRGAFAWSRSGSLATVSGKTVLSNPDLSVRIDGTLSEDSNAAGYMDGTLGLGPFVLSLSAQQGISDGIFSDGSFGYSLELPLPNLQFKDSFEYSPSSGRFGRRDGLAFHLGTFQFGMDQSAVYVAEALEQIWNLGLSAGASLSLNARLENTAAGSLDLDPSYGRAWLESFRYVLPALEGSSARRRTKVSGFINASEGIFNFAAESGILNAASADPAAWSSAQARFGWSFPVGKGSLEPYYSRTWRLDDVSANSRFLDDWAFWASSLAVSEYLYRSAPFAELFDAATGNRFRTAAEGVSSSGYTPEAGIVMSRRYGSRWTDLIVPSKGTIAFRRQLSSSLETVTDAWVGEVSASAAAVNLFGARGVYRSTSLYSVDEFSQRLSALVTVHREDGVPLSSLTHRALASFYTDREDSLVAENRAAFSETRDGTAWSEQLALTLTLRPVRTWLGDLAILLFNRPFKEKSENHDTEGVQTNIVSGYLAGLKGEKGRLTEIWSLSASVKRPYAYLDRYDFKLTQSYETKYSAAQRFFLSAGLGAFQELNLVSRLDYWTLGLELTLSARILF